MMEITSTPNFPKVNIIKGKKHSLDKTTLKKTGQRERAADCLIFANIWGTYIWAALTYWTRDLSTVTIDVLKHVIFGCFGSSWLFPQHFHAYFTLQHRTVASDGIFWATVEWGSGKTPECFSCKAWLEVIFSIAASSSSWQEQTWDAF